MAMKKIFILSILTLVMPLATWAQDDLYFVPAKDKSDFQHSIVKTEPSTYYAGINKSDADYNRRGHFHSSYQKIGKDSLGNDIVLFDMNDAKRDTIYQVERLFDNGESDFAYSQQMNRFDDGWDYYPWRYRGSFYYDTWWGWNSWYDDYYYGPWNDYGWYRYYGWYSPWRYGYYRWGWPYYSYGWYPYWYGWWTPRYYGRVYGHTGTANHWANGRVFNRSTTGYRGNINRNDNGRVTFGNATVRSNRFGGTRNDGNVRFNGSRNNNSLNNNRQFTPNRNNSFGNGTRSSIGGGNFGGSRGGGSGTRTGGGRFGGRR